MAGPTVLVAMSGGVDSSVAAALLIDAGCDVVGVTMKLWGGDSDTGCCSVSDVDDARRVAQQLGIDHHVFNFGEDFDEHVVQPYVAAHAAGRTPNPCIECNRHLKFDRLLRRAAQLGVETLATGHHARILDRGAVRHVARGVDRAKDQSYVLHMLEQAALARLRFPVGGMTKADVRARAAALGLRTAAKPDSQDVCFITTAGGRSRFLGERLSMHPATVVDTSGRAVGAVDGVELVTLGQRRGLGHVGGGERRYVVDIDRTAGVVTVGSRADLMVESVALDDLGWAESPIVGEVLAQCSAHGRPQRGSIDGSGVLVWETRQHRVAPGQAVVLYDLEDLRVLGGGVASG